MANIKRIDHIAIVVEDLESALTFWGEALGLELSHMEEVPAQESVVAFLPTGDSEVELVNPTTDSSGVARYLQKRGPGIHHICFEVDDIEDALNSLRGRGIRLINETPEIGAGGKRIAFVHPSSAHGVLIELYETRPQEEERRIRLARARRLASRMVLSGQALGAGVGAFLRVMTNRNGEPIELEEDNGLDH